MAAGWGANNVLDLLCIGEAMAELRRGDDGAFAVGFAGDTFNTAVYCKRALGDHAKIAFKTRVGLDPLSADFTAMANGEALDSAAIEQDAEKLIGIYAVSTDANGERSFSYWRQDSAARKLFSRIDENLPPARITYLSGITLAILSFEARKRVLERLRAASDGGETLVAFDSNYRPKLWESADAARETMQEMWDIADIALPSIDDEMALFGDDCEDAVIKRFGGKEWHACAIKRAERGPVSLKLAPQDLPEFRPAERVLDTTAAGDSFNAGYFAGLLSGEDEAACMLRGHNLASHVVGVRGAISPRT